MNKNNLSKLLYLEKKQPGFLSKICNHFEEIREFGRSNKGSQRYRKVTVDMCLEYFYEKRFKGTSESNEDILPTIRKYTRNQSTFDKASQIREEYLSLREQGLVTDHLLGEELKEDVFFEIEDEKKKISFTTLKILDDLKDISSQIFTYEFLSKYDPENFVLGKYCSCCAHLEGIGRGIVKASILHPDCQNLIIRDKKGKIIAKSTLYINREQGYGVFNNFEMNYDIKDKRIKTIIYNKYMQAIYDFVEVYNQKHPNNPIKQINVGMGINALDSDIRRNNIKSKSILLGIDFSEYGGYTGDWQKEQYILWPNKCKIKISR